MRVCEHACHSSNYFQEIFLKCNRGYFRVYVAIEELREFSKGVQTRNAVEDL